MITLFHVTPQSNVDSIMKNGLLPKIGERSKRIEEEEMAFFFKTYEDCETALEQWLGDEFEDLEENLFVLKVELPDDFPLIETADWEMATVSIVEPKYISVYKKIEWK